MPVTVTCPNCGDTRRLRDEALGKRVRCRNCDAAVLVEPQDEFDDYDEDYGSGPHRRAPSQQSGQSRRRRSASRHAGMPQKAKETILALATAGLLWSVFGGMGLYLMQTDDIDALGRGITYYLLLLGVGGFVCAGLLWQRVAAGKYLAMVVSVFYLVFFPLGTIVAVIVYRGLLSADLDQYLSAR